MSKNAKCNAGNSKEISSRYPVYSRRKSPLTRMQGHKKGISPLIATTILVAFTVFLGVVIMNFVQKSYFDLQTQADKQIERGIKCSLDLAIKVLEIDSEDYICYNRSGSNNLEVIVENGGTVDAKGVQIFVLDSDNNPYTAYELATLGGHNRTKYNISLNSPPVSFNFSFPPSKIIISPILSSAGGVYEICTDNRIELEDLEQCS